MFPGYPLEHEQRALQRRPAPPAAPRYAGEMDWLNEVYGRSPHFA